MNYLKLYQKFGAHHFIFSKLGYKMVEPKNKVLCLTYDKEFTVCKWLLAWNLKHVICDLIDPQRFVLNWFYQLSINMLLKWLDIQY